MHDGHNIRLEKNKSEAQHSFMLQPRLLLLLGAPVRTCNVIGSCAYSTMDTFCLCIIFFKLPQKSARRRPVIDVGSENATSTW